MTVRLLRPTLERLPAFLTALSRGWSPDNVRGEESAREMLQQAAHDPEVLLSTMDDPHGRAGPIRLPDGSEAQRLPGYQRFIWDGEFCGVIGLRWAPGTSELPAYVLGHIGYAVTPWKRGMGRATAALGLMLIEARAEGLAWVELTTDPENLPSQKVILANGGWLVERFEKPAVYGGGESLRYRIDLA